MVCINAHLTAAKVGIFHISNGSNCVCFHNYRHIAIIHTAVPWLRVLLPLSTLFYNVQAACLFHTCLKKYNIKQNKHVAE